MNRQTKPRIVVSKCLGFAACRYNGLLISSAFVRRLKDHVDFIPVCPEQGIGLGVPRDPIRIIKARGRRILYQPATGRDLNKEMNSFVRDFFSGLGPVDGFILKSRSPSCGIRDVKVYSGFKEKQILLSDTSHGFFGGRVMERYPGLAIEDDTRLKNAALRDSFLTSVFSRAHPRKP